MTETQLDGILRKVRALFATAEDPATPEEARDAFYDKAQHLITRYGIDTAALAGADPSEVIDRIVKLDGKYQGEHAFLIYKVAEANNCRTVHLSPAWSRRRADGHKGHSVHVFGRAADVEWVELLSTSLWLQATRAVLNAPLNGYSPQDLGAVRRSFLRGFIISATNRLRKAAAAEAGPSESNSLVLIDAAEQARREVYPTLVKARSRGTNRGRLEGKTAGANADVGAHRVSARRALGAGA